MSSHIRAFVQWKEQTVFAGEDIQCIITFTNLAPISPIPVSSNANRDSKLNGLAVGHDRARKSFPAVNAPTEHRRTSVTQGLPPQGSRGHRSALSINLPPHHLEARAQVPEKTTQNHTRPTSHGHTRSVSIISLGGSDAGQEALSPPRLRTSRSKNHVRSASIQVIPPRGPHGNGSSAGGHSPRAAANPSPLSNVQTAAVPIRPELQSDLSRVQRSHRRPGSVVPYSHLRTQSRSRENLPNPFNANFKFPPGPSDVTPPASDSSSLHPAETQRSPRKISPRASIIDSDSTSITGSLHLAPITKVKSGSSMNGSTRSSGEFYSLSNNSSETLASEYVSQPYNRLLGHLRRPSNLSISQSQSSIEHLMMGYVQVMGTFTLDGSLVNQGPFEEVKRKGVVSGQGGGGVVGVENSKRGNGLLSSFGWSSIGESLGGFLGGGELSSIREMRGIASTRSIPLLSTPQSILFVDLQLAPGESRSYSYSFTLPKGLPPSHKGKAIKISYNLVIGTQRPAISKQHVQRVEVPFRVFGSVNRNGEILGHDLMSPYIILRDQAHTSILESVDIPLTQNKALKDAQQELPDFLTYTSNLLARSDNPDTSQGSALLSPTATSLSRISSESDVPSTVKEIVSLAILRSNIPKTANVSPNRFEIARNGRRIASILLNRPAHRLGETLLAVVDFRHAHIPCYSIRASLESFESVDPAIAMRSPTSIYRVTKRVHASLVENTLFTQRVVFSPTIPMTATPEFITSGVNLNWRLKVEFVTSRVDVAPIPQPAKLQKNKRGSSRSSRQNDETEPLERNHSTHRKEYRASDDVQLLKPVNQDDRGITRTAVDTIPCESFEVAIPITVYGATTGETEKLEVEGLIV